MDDRSREDRHRWRRSVVNLCELTMARHDEAAEGEPLHRPVMLGGVRLEEVRAYARLDLGRLPAALRSVEKAERSHPAEVSPGFRSAFEVLRRTLEVAEVGGG